MSDNKAGCASGNIFAGCLNEFNSPEHDGRSSGEREIRCANGRIFRPVGIESQTVADGQMFRFESERVEETVFTDYCTLKMCTKERPAFPLGEVFGKYERYPLGENDCDGGLRTKGIYKKDSAKFPLITYVTVVFNRIDTLPRCMESVFRQDYPNIEYIVVDGASTDGTLDLIKAHEEHIDYYMSQKDCGIYNAMNKAISLASGRVICFINSDDFCAEGAASKIGEICRRKDPDLIMGRRKFINDKGKITNEIELPQLRIRNCAMYALPIHHQSAYANRRMFEELGYYNESFKYIADYRWESRCMTISDRLYFTEEILSVFSLGGLTGTSLSIRRWDEWTRLIGEVFPKLTKTQCEILQYGFRHYFGFSDISAIIKSMGKNMEDPALARVIYECGYYITYVQIYTLKSFACSNGMLPKITKNTVLACREEGWAVGTLQGIMGQILVLLRKTTKMDDFVPTKEEMDRLCALKRVINASNIEARKTLDLKHAKTPESKAAVEREYAEISSAVTDGKAMLKLAKKPFIVKGLGE